MALCRVIQMQFIFFFSFFFAYFKMWFTFFAKINSTNQIRPWIGRARSPKLNITFTARKRQKGLTLAWFFCCSFCLFRAVNVIHRCNHITYWCSEFTYVACERTFLKLSKPFSMEHIMMRKMKWWNFLVAFQFFHFSFTQWQCHPK